MIKIPKDESISIYEHFQSIQGEGFHTGKPAYFIRFAGCDIGCPWCDTKDAWSEEKSHPVNIDELITIIKNNKSQIVVITGGEPLIHNIFPLTSLIRKEGKQVYIETSGAYPILAEFDWLTLSPKKIFNPVEEAYTLANELKIVIEQVIDLDYALDQSLKVKPECHLFLQPAWKAREEILPHILDFIQDHPNWRLSLQVHKFIGIP